MPISEAQRAANQANARRSTGPRTPEGKAASARNSFRHGFRSSSVLLPGDDPAEYDLLLDLLTAEHQPDGLEQDRCVREMADAEWRLRRARSWIQSTHTRLIQQLEPSADPAETQAQAFIQGKAELDPILRHEAKFERQYDRAVRRLQALQRQAPTRPAKDAEKAENETSEPVSPESPPPIPSTPRNAPCPCGSKIKFKRCCGRNAPPVLNHLPRAA